MHTLEWELAEVVSSWDDISVQLQRQSLNNDKMAEQLEQAQSQYKTLKSSVKEQLDSFMNQMTSAMSALNAKSEHLIQYEHRLRLQATKLWTLRTMYKTMQTWL